MVIDVVSNSGRVWACIIARNAKQIRWKGEAYGNKTGVKNRVKELLLALESQASGTSIMLCLPEATDPDILQKLEEKFNAELIGTNEAPSNLNHFENTEYFKSYHPLFLLIAPPSLPNRHEISDFDIKYVNLDTSTLIAICSDISNGKSNVFLEKS